MGKELALVQGFLTGTRTFGKGGGGGAETLANGVKQSDGGGGGEYLCPEMPVLPPPQQAYEWVRSEHVPPPPGFGIIDTPRTTLIIAREKAAHLYH